MYNYIHLFFVIFSLNMWPHIYFVTLVSAGV